MSMYNYQHGVYQTIYHLTWQTKCRYEMMRKEKYRLAARQAIEEVGARHGIHFVELAVMSDHVHAVVSVHPSMSQCKALGLLKGGSAYILFRAHPKMRLRYPRGHFWSPGKAGRTVGDADKEIVMDCVERQRLCEKTSRADHASRLFQLKMTDWIPPPSGGGGRHCKSTD